MIRRLEPQIGFGWTTRIIAFIILAVLTVPVLGLRPRQTMKSLASRQKTDLTAWKETPFTAFAVGTFLAFTGLYIPYFYIQVYGLSAGGVSSDLAFYLVSTLNAGSLLGRIVSSGFPRRDHLQWLTEDVDTELHSR